MRWFLLLLSLLLPVSVLAQTGPCAQKRTQVNTLGQGTEITVASVAVQVLQPSDLRCTALVRNSGVNPMRCLPSAQGAPTTSRGLLFDADKQLLMTTESREAWYCIATGSGTTVETIEGLP
jgi:hypothetical protein